MGKPINSAGLHPAQRPLTEEEKKIKVMQILQQKRESFAINILCNLCKNEVVTKVSLVETAVKMADELIEKLYPMPEVAD